MRYLYNGKLYTLAELYRKIRKRFKKDRKTGLMPAIITVRLPDSDEDSVIVFCKGCREPEKDDAVKGIKKGKKSGRAAFLSTDTSLHSSAVINKYTRRWATEVCCKECKQMLALGKEQSRDFNGQVFAATASFMRYNLLNCLNEKENYATLGELFAHLADDYAVITYSQRLRDFFHGLFLISFETVFNLFEIEDDFQSCIDVLTDALKGFMPIGGAKLELVKLKFYLMYVKGGTHPFLLD